jgi:SAM-dependent methyltransferase
MAKSYEELEGAAGHARFFRPTRHDAVRLFAGSPPNVFFDDDEFKLLDMSGVGLGCQLQSPNAAIALDAVNRSGVLRLVQHGREIYRTKARCARVSQGRGGVVAGFALEEDIFDFDLLRVANAKALAGQMSTYAAAETPLEYKALCADALEFVGGMLAEIDRHITPIESRLTTAEKAQAVSEIEEMARPQWNALLEAGNAMVRPWHDDNKLRPLLKRYTENTLTRLLVGGSSWGRSYFKPAGYPGDYIIMNYMYDQNPVGLTAREMMLHALGVSAGEPIVTRMNKLSEIIAEFGERRGGDGKPIDIMSIGCGPARELERLAALSRNGMRWRATLVDQEPEAIEYAMSYARQKGVDRTVEINPLNLSFTEMLVPSAVTHHFVDKDVIYSSGMVDYLSPMSARRFVKRMYDFLRPGGRLIIGNVNDLSTGTLWPMEYVLDWTLYFRNHAEMTAMAGGVEGAEDIRVVSDDRNAIFFLIIEKPV